MSMRGRCYATFFFFCGARKSTALLANCLGMLAMHQKRSRKEPLYNNLIF
jgi:hypothetical protein